MFCVAAAPSSHQCEGGGGEGDGTFVESVVFHDFFLIGRFTIQSAKLEMISYFARQKAFIACEK